MCCYELSYDIQIGTTSASFQAALEKDKRDLTKVSIIFVAKNMPQNLVSRHAVTSYLFDSLPPPPPHTHTHTHSDREVIYFAFKSMYGIFTMQYV